MTNPLTQFDGKRICILGFGREGQANYEALRQFAPQAHLTIADANQEIDVPTGVASQLGAEYLRNLEQFDAIFKTPGIPDLPELQAVQSKIVTATQLFLTAARAAGATVIGVTGSKGKSTTSALIYAALRAGGKPVDLVGNIGVPVISYLGKITAGHVFVAELSSYQLHDVTVSPQIAVVTSFFAEHLTYHGTIDKYWAAKKRIAQFQTAEDTVLYNAASPECTELAQASPGTKIGFTAQDLPLPIEATKLLGQHNMSNLAAALKVALLCGVTQETALTALKNFTGLPHRLQVIGTYNDIQWIDDSFSTAPDATLAALKALEGKVHTLIVGGVDRGYTFDELGAYLAQSAVNTLVIFPETGAAIQAAIAQHHPAAPKDFYSTTSMAEAVAYARAHTPAGSICLLSSGAPSFNLFKNFEDRGEQFTKAVRG